MKLNIWTFIFCRSKNRIVSLISSGLTVGWAQQSQHLYASFSLHMHEPLHVYAEIHDLSIFLVMALSSEYTVEFAAESCINCTGYVSWLYYNYVSSLKSPEIVIQLWSLQFSKTISKQNKISDNIWIKFFCLTLCEFYDWSVISLCINSSGY